MKHPVLMTNAIDFHCYRCGVYIDSGDVWQTHCDRCAELERLEREIGRTAIRNVILHGAKQGAMGDSDAMWIIHEAFSRDAEPFGILTLIARWRELHAGAEEER